MKKMLLLNVICQMHSKNITLLTRLRCFSFTVTRKNSVSLMALRVSFPSSGVFLNNIFSKEFSHSDCTLKRALN